MLQRKEVRAPRNRPKRKSIMLLHRGTERQTDWGCQGVSSESIRYREGTQRGEPLARTKVMARRLKQVTTVRRAEVEESAGNDDDLLLQAFCEE
jgi:hypothetical protein